MPIFEDETHKMFKTSITSAMLCNAIASFVARFPNSNENHSIV